MSEFRRDIHRALDALAQPVPALHSRSMAAVRARNAGRVERGSRFGWLAGVATLLLALAVVGVFQLQNRGFFGHTPTRQVVDSGVWNEDLTLTGNARGHVTSTVANTPAIRSSCTGKTSRAIGKYSLQLWVIWTRVPIERSATSIRQQRTCRSWMVGRDRCHSP